MAAADSAEDPPRGEPVGPAASIPPGRARRVTIGDRPISVWNVDGRFVAVDDRCPHQGASLAHGFLQDGVIVCRWHGMRFDPTTGEECVLGLLTLDCFPVTEQDGELYVSLESRPGSVGDLEVDDGVAAHLTEREGPSDGEEAM